MSADNTIAILATQGPKIPYVVNGQRRFRRKTEYRVAHVQAVENVFASWGSSPRECELDALFAQWLFGDCEVFTDQRFAEGFAHGMLHQRGEDTVEYGVRLLDFRHVRFPSCQQPIRRHLRE